MIKIGREDILQVLEKYPEKKFRSKEIQEHLKIGFSSLCNGLKSIRRFNEANFEKSILNKYYVYWYKDTQNA